MFPILSTYPHAEGFEILGDIVVSELFVEVCVPSGPPPVETEPRMYYDYYFHFQPVSCVACIEFLNSQVEKATVHLI